MSTLSAQTRKRIVYRINGAKTVVQASAITNIEELVYAIGFLAHHRLYKMSKGSAAVSVSNAADVADAFSLAAEEFTEDVIDELVAPKAYKGISELGAGVVENPFKYV